MSTLRALFAVPACFAAFACGGTMTSEDGVDDNHAEIRTLEGAEIPAALDAGGVSAPVQIATGFTRLGLIWDAVDASALEVRLSDDGVTWGAWQVPTVVSSEEQNHVGHVDGDGAWYQFRVPAGVAAPTFLVLDPIEEVLALPDEPVVEDDGISSTQSAITTPIGELRIYSRKEWGAKAPRCALASQTPNRATIHHTVTPTVDSMTPQARLRQIQAFHMYTRGWCDIGYNYLVSRDGRVWRGRGAVKVGAHVANNNTGNVGISFMGTHTSTGPTSKQMCNTAKLLAELHRDWPALALTRTDVKGHRQYGGTSCPGTALYNRIDDIVRKSRGGCSVQ